jgi:hypothetical protein
MPGEKRVELASKEEIDPYEQDRRHDRNVPLAAQVANTVLAPQPGIRSDANPRREKP